MLTKQEIVKQLSQVTGASQREVSMVLDCLGILIRESVAAGETFRLPGVGAFKAADRASRRVRNPQTGEEIIIPPTRRVKFSAAAEFKRRVAEGK